MRRAIVVLALVILARSAAAQGPVHAVRLDSGTVVRLHWAGSRPVRATLLTPLGPQTDTVRFCRYPSPQCGPASINPPRERSLAGLERIEVRQRGRIGRRALFGAGIGVLVGGVALGMAESLGETRLSTGRQLVLMSVSVASISAIGALLDLGSDRWAAPATSP
jgi:hypothetical protein